MNIPLTLAELQRMVQQLFQQEQFLLEPHELYAPIDYTLQLGGKRIRPIMLLAACQLFGGDIDKARHAAVGIEVFHNFTLLHDDLMDRSPLRRGQETVYRKWDENTAILSGDAMLIMAYQYLTKEAYESLPEVLATFNNMAVEVMQGQQYDMNFERRDDVSGAEYLDMIYLKTAALFNGALRIGALLAQAPPEQLPHLHEFGRHLGLAFQLQDDMLDTFGDETTFGKKPGQDIRDNKKTMLLITAQQKATDSQRDELNRWLEHQPADSDEKVEAVRALYEAIGVRNEVQQQIEAHYRKAVAALKLIDAESRRKEPMQELMWYLLRRNK